MDNESPQLHTPAETFVKLAGFIKDSKIALFTAATSDGTLHSRPLLTQQVDVAGNALWFFAASNFHKVDEILDQKEVALSYVSPDKKSYVSISGQAHVVHDKFKAQELWTPDAVNRFSEGVDDPRLVVVRVDLEAVEYWDSP